MPTYFSFLFYAALSPELRLCYWSFPVQIPNCRSDWKPERGSKSEVLRPPPPHTHTHILYGQKYTHRNTPNSIPPLFDTKLQYYLADCRRTSAPLLSYSHPPPLRGRRISSIRNDWIRKFSCSGKYRDDQPSQWTSFKASFWKDAERGCFWPEADKLRSAFLLPRWNTMLTEENWSEPFSCMFQHTHT